MVVEISTSPVLKRLNNKSEKEISSMRRRAKYRVKTRYMGTKGDDFARR